MAGSKKNQTLEYDWDPQKTVIVHNKSTRNILLDLPTGYFRLDAGRSFGMTRDIADLQQVKDLRQPAD
ncbi:MAG: hypothetical protein R2844_03205 [Caldilineales bacterium]